MTEAPNPLRCETCKDITCWLCKGNPYYDKVMASKNHNKEHREEIAEFRDFVKIKGCASHSSTTSAEKVLDDLKKTFQEINKEGGFRPWNLGHIEDVIRDFKAELRQQEKKGA